MKLAQQNKTTNILLGNFGGVDVVLEWNILHNHLSIYLFVQVFIEPLL